MTTRRAAAILAATFATMAAWAAPAAFAGPLPPYFDIAKLPAPPVTGKELADGVAHFSETYRARYTGSVPEQQATDFLAEEATKLGYQVEVVPMPQAGEPFTFTHAVIATKPGTTKPGEHIVYSTHYDSFPGTVEASYDNGSGTAMLLGLAKSLAAVKTNRTLVFAWYNGEEEGALGSDVHATSFKEENKVVRALLGFDMVGIAYPVAQPGETNCLCMWHGDEDEALGELLNHVNFTVLGFPNAENLVEMRGANDRNSDEASWDAQGYPTMRWAGLKTASDYEQYHMPEDNMAAIDEEAGGRTFFEQGMRNTLLSSYFTTLAIDNDMPTAVPTATGSGPVTFDGSGSSDPDGPVGGHTWSFGDGASAEGAKVTHTYEKPGDYVATLTVKDNLWPAVTASASVPVKVLTGSAPPPVVQKKPSACVAKARKIKNAAKRRAAIKKCGCQAKAKKIKNDKKRKAALRRCAKPRKRARRG